MQFIEGVLLAVASKAKQKSHSKPAKRRRRRGFYKDAQKTSLSKLLKPSDDVSHHFRYHLHRRYLAVLVYGVRRVDVWAYGAGL